MRQYLLYNNKLINYFGVYSLWKVFYLKHKRGLRLSSWSEFRILNTIQLKRVTVKIIDILLTNGLTLLSCTGKANNMYKYLFYLTMPLFLRFSTGYRHVDSKNHVIWCTVYTDVGCHAYLMSWQLSVPRYICADECRTSFPDPLPITRIIQAQAQYSPHNQDYLGIGSILFPYQAYPGKGLLLFLQPGLSRHRLKIWAINMITQAQAQYSPHNRVIQS